MRPFWTGTPLVVKVRDRMIPEPRGPVSTVTATPATISVPEAARIMGLSRNGAYAAAARGDIPTIRIGRKLLVPTQRLRAMLEGPTEQEAAP
jgi:excisionase family DNA binding protein